MISIVIVNYNSDLLLNKCLESICNSSLNDIKIEIIIVHNNKRQCKISLKKDTLSLKNIFIGKNIGYSKAINIGILEASYKTLITMNPDVELKKNSISQIFNHFKSNNDIGIIGCKVLNIDKSFQKSSRRRFPSLNIIIPYILKFHSFGFTNRYNYMDLSNEKIHKVDAVSGCFMMFNKDVYSSVGGFDEQFFLYFEDTDFCYKVTKLGLNNTYYPKAEIIHLKNGSRNYINYLFVTITFYLSFLKFILKYNRIFFKLNN
tara:strand:+ start:10431 stop:11210 length:780 start_codon:yes stop_codon:yes gene_type:complete